MAASRGHGQRQTEARRTGGTPCPLGCTKQSIGCTPWPFGRTKKGIRGTPCLRVLLPALALALASALARSTCAMIPEDPLILPGTAVRKLKTPHAVLIQNASSQQRGLARGHSRPTRWVLWKEEEEAGAALSRVGPVTAGDMRGPGIGPVTAGDLLSLGEHSRPRRRVLSQEKEEAGASPRDWPSEMLGKHEWSDYVGPVRIRNKGVASCYGVRSHPGTEPQKVIADVDVNAQDIRRMETTFSAQGEAYSGPRIVIWVAKNGLGNVVRGFLTTFFYALLSGRQLVRSEEGSHGKVMRSLCHGFSCPYINKLHFRGRLPRSTLNICHHHLESTLRDPRPTMVGDCDVLLRFWAHNQTLRSCVLDTFGCADDWCALSRAELLLLGAPSLALAPVIDSAMVLVPALPLEATAAAAEGAAEQWRRQLGEGTGHGAKAPLTAQDRTVTELRVKHPAAEQWRRQLGKGTGHGGKAPLTAQDRTVTELRVKHPAAGQGRRQLGEGTGQQPPAVSSWLGRFASGLVASIQAKDRRPRLPANGQDSRQENVEGGKPRGGEKGSAAEAEKVPKSLRLKFDLGLHIRTLYRCVEKSASGPGCEGKDAAHAVAAAVYSTELRKFVHHYDWHCLSTLLAFLHRLKFPLEQKQQQGRRTRMIKEDDKEFPGGQQQQRRRIKEDNKESSGGQQQQQQQQQQEQEGDEASPSPPPLFATQEDQGSLQAFLEETSKVSLPTAAGHAMWSEDKAKLFASREIANRAARGNLSIFLATDSEVLRPLFVEFLRPFGRVVYSQGKVVHLDRGTADESARLPTVAEFFLLSKASVLVSFTGRMSSFLQHAAMYGNGTLLSRGGKQGCRFVADHVAEVPKMP